MWSLALERHLDVLRAQLLTKKEQWPQITRRAKLGKNAVMGFVKRYDGFRNPGIASLQAMADALEALEREQQETSRAL